MVVVAMHSFLGSQQDASVADLQEGLLMANDSLNLNTNLYISDEEPVTKQEAQLSPRDRAMRRVN